MSYLVRLPDDLWQWSIRKHDAQMRGMTEEQQAFVMGMDEMMYPGDDPENQVMEIPETLWRCAQIFCEESPEDAIIAVLRAEMRDNP